MVLGGSTEAEYKALVDGAKEAVYLRRLLLKLCTLICLPTPISCADANIHTDLKEACIPTTLDTHLHCDNQGWISSSSIESHFPLSNETLGGKTPLSKRKGVRGGAPTEIHTY